MLNLQMGNYYQKKNLLNHSINCEEELKNFEELDKFLGIRKKAESKHIKSLF